jgi:hypothetical protein
VVALSLAAADDGAEFFPAWWEAGLQHTADLFMVSGAVYF